MSIIRDFKAEAKTKIQREIWRLEDAERVSPGSGESTEYLRGLARAAQIVDSVSGYKGYQEKLRATRNAEGRAFVIQIPPNN